MRSLLKGTLVILLLFGLNTIAFSQKADFESSLTDNKGCSNTTVFFTINDPKDIDTYHWSFGNGEPDVSGTLSDTDDGSTSTFFQNTGDFDVTLTVNEGAGNEKTKTETLTISGRSDFDIDYYVQPHDDMTADGCFVGDKQSIDLFYDGDAESADGLKIVTWIWNAGDGTIEEKNDDKHFHHDYTEPGIYTTSLTAIDENGCEYVVIKEASIKLYATPQVDFSYEIPETCDLPIMINFIDETINTETGDGTGIGDWHWIFKDDAGNVLGTSTEQNPSYPLPEAGDYAVILAVGPEGLECYDEMTQLITIADGDVNTIGFTPDTQTTICEGESVTFTNNSLDPNGTPSAYLWDFGDGTTSTDENPVHAFTVATGSPFTVSLSVTFSNGCNQTLTMPELIVVNSTVANLSLDKNESCQDFTVVATSDPGYALYEWDFNYDGITPNIMYSDILNTVSHTYIGEGSYSVFLRVTSTIGCTDETVYEGVVIQYPVADYIVIGGDIGCQDVLAQFDASGSTNNLPSGANGIIEYQWDFENDGLIDFSSSDPTASHSFYIEGDYSVALTIITADGCTDTIVKSASISRGEQPTASFTFDQTDLCRGTPVQFHSTSVGTPTADIDSIIWDFADGTIISGNPQLDAALNDPLHTFGDDTEDDGISFDVVLTVFVNGCQSDSATNTIDIGYPIARFETDEEADCAGGSSAIHFNAYDGDRLSEGVDEYRWDFGDGTYYPGPTANDWAIGNNPTTEHQFSSLGTFTVSLYAKNNTSSCEDVFESSIAVESGFVSFEADETIVCRGESVEFTNTSVSSETGVVYIWDFGADALPQSFTGAIPPPVNWATNGLKTISLSSSATSGCNNQLVRTDYIDVRGPVASFISESSIGSDTVQCLNPNEYVVFTSTTGSSSNVNANTIFEWDFGPSAVPSTVTRANEDPIQVSFTTSGLHTVTLKVTDELGCVDEITKVNAIIVPEVTANFDVGADLFCVGSDISFSDLSTGSDNIAITQWEWDFGLDATPATFSGQTPPVVTYASKGDKTINLMVTNATGCSDGLSKNITIYESDASFTTDVTQGCGPLTVQFANTSDDIISWLWDFGDGSNVGTSEQNPLHTYFYPGEYTVTLTTTSLGGCETTITQDALIKVEGSTYTDLTYTMDQPCLANPVDPTATFTIFGLMDTKSIHFDFDDGTSLDTTIADAANPPAEFVITHTYSSIGTFNPTFSLQNDPNLATVACPPTGFTPEIEPIIIIDPPTADFDVAIVGSGNCANMEVQFTDLSTSPDFKHPITDWLWEFGDPGNSTSNLQNPTFVYSAAGDVTVTLTIYNDIGCSNSVAKTYTIVDGIDDPTVGTTTSLCEGTTTTLDGAIPSSTSGIFVYEWQESLDQAAWATAAGTANEEDYTTEVYTPTNATTYYYRRLVQSGDCETISDVFTVTTSPLSIGGAIAVNSSETMQCYGLNSGTLTLSGQTGDIVEWQYDTQSDFSSVQSIANTTTTHDYTNLTESTYYRVVVKSGDCDQVYSDVATVSVTEQIVGNEFNPDNMIICAQDDPGILLPSNPTRGAGGFTYQWQQSIDNTTFVDIAGATAEDYSPGPLNETRYYRRNVSTNGSCTVSSNTYTVEVIPNPDGSLELPDAEFCAEAVPPTFNIIVKSSELDVVYTAYQVSDDTQVGTPVNGTGEDIGILINSPTVTTTYYVRAESSKTTTGGTTCMVDLIDQTIFNIIPQPLITISVTDDTICKGATARLTVQSPEANVTYLLVQGSVILSSYTSTDNTDFDFVLSGASSPEVTTSYQVWARSALLQGNCNPVKMTAEPTVTVLPAPDPDAHTVSDPFVCVGAGNFDIEVTNTSADVNYTLSEQGQPSGATLAGNGGTLVFSVAEPAASTTYEVSAKSIVDSSDGACDPVLITDVAMVTLIPTPDGASQVVSDHTVCQSDFISISITNTEMNVEYALYEGGNPYAGVPAIAGNGGTATFAPFAPSASTTFEVMATSTVDTNCGSTTVTDNAVVNVIEQIDQNLVVTTSATVICSGSSADITVESTETDVTYTLQTGTTPVPGQEFVGDGTNQSFTVSPTINTTYNILATPSVTDDNGNLCAGSVLSTEATIDVDGPLSFTEEPVDAQVCAGTSAQFSAKAVNATGGLVNYQWQESSDNVTFTDIGGQTGENLLVNSPYSNYYRVSAYSANCTDIYSASAVVNSTTPIGGSSLVLDIGDVCSGDDIVVNYDASGLALNESYQVTYNVSGANTASGTSDPFLLSTATGSFTIAATDLPNTGVNTFTITEINFAYGQQCEETGLNITDNFTIEPLPDVSALILTADDICYGSDATVTISTSLTNGVYVVHYDLSGANIGVQQTTNLAVSSGESILSIPANLLTATGLTTITITDVRSGVGQTCSSTGLSESTEFDVLPSPDVSSMAVRIDNICYGYPATVNLTSNLASGIYIMNYELSGANTGSDVAFFDLSDGSGTGEFIIAQSQLITSGVTNFEITNIGYIDGNPCALDNVGVSTSFEIEASPDMSGATIVAPAVCLGDDATIYITSNLENGTYEVKYTISGDNPVHSDVATMSVTDNTGNGSFIIDDSFLPNSGITDITINNVYFTDGLQCFVETSVHGSLKVEGPITIIDQPVDADVCAGTTAQFQVNATNESGDDINYQWQSSADNGATFNDIAGEIYAMLTVPSGSTDLYKVLVASITCSVIESEIVQVNTEAVPITDDMTISVDEVCLGSDVEVAYTSTLATGIDYKVFYEVTGANTISTSEIITLNSASGVFSLSAANFPNTGLNTLTITEIDYANSLGCSNSGLTISDAFNIVPSPDPSSLTLSSESICFGDDGQVEFTGSLADNIYTITYNLTGSNTATGLSDLITITGGIGTYTLSASELPNLGTTQFVLTDISNYLGSNCQAVDVNLSTEFDVREIPDASSIVLTIPDICYGYDALVSVSGSLGDGAYMMDYELTGANTTTSVAFFPISGGVGEFIIEKALLTNSGSNTIEITDISYLDGNPCALDNVGVSETFEVEASPDMSGATIVAPAICNGEDGIIGITSNLEDGTYDVNYSITGANPDHTDDAIMIVTGNLGNGSFVIDKSFLPNSGTTDITINNVYFTDGLQCFIETSVHGTLEIEGPVTILTQPVDAEVCAGATAEFTVDATNESGGSIIYQWQSSSDGGVTFADIPAEISATLSVPSGSTDLYKVLVSSTTCSAIESDVVKVNTGATPIVDNMTITIADICQDSDVVVNYTSSLATGEEYRIFYKIDGANTVAETSTVVLLYNANGSFTIPAGNLPNPGLNTFTITALDYANGTGCSQSGLTVTDDFTIEAAPDVTNLILAASDICSGDDEVVDITGSLSDNTYTVTYDISGANTLASQTTSLTIVGGSGQLTIPAADLINAGTNTFTISNVELTTGMLCSVNPVAGSADFDIIPTPVTGLTVTDPTICAGDDAIITIKASEPNVEYTLSPGGLTVVGDGTDVSFTAVSPAVSTDYTVTATTTIIGSCGDTPLDDIAQVTVIPQVSDVHVVALDTDVCYGSSVNISVEATEVDVLYTLRIGTTPVPGQELVGNGADQSFVVSPTEDVTYNVFAQNRTTDDNANLCNGIQLTDLALVNVDGPITITTQPVDADVCSGVTAQFTVDALNESGDPISYQWQSSTDNGATFTDMGGEISPTLSVPSGSTDLYKVVISTLFCPSVESDVVKVNTGLLPITDDLTITIDDVCLDTDILVSYTSSLTTGVEYKIYFDVSGTNNLSASEIITLSSASGTFTLSAANFPNTGLNTLTITEIDYVNGLGCSNSGLSISDPFNIAPLPDVSSLTLSSESICIGNDGQVDITGSLADNIYTITYNLTGSNTGTGLTGALAVTAGAGSYTIPATELVNLGTTQFEITDIANSVGIVCQVANVNATSEFDVLDIPDASSVVLAIPNICYGYDAMVSVSGSLGDGVYMMDYELTGANTATSAAFFPISGGVGEFIIEKALLTNPGINTFEITNISFLDGNPCALDNVGVSETFEVEASPDMSGATILAPAICNGEDGIIGITSNLEDGTYDVNFSITGANPDYTGDAIMIVTGNLGNGLFVIDKSFLPNSGTTDITINNVYFTDGLQCFIETSVHGTLEIEGPLTIVEQPADAEVCAGLTAEFTVDAINESGGNIYYQWQVSTDGGTVFADSVGQVTSTLSVNSNSANTYRVMLSSDYCAPVYSNSVVVNSGATPIVDNMTITIDDVCLDTDVIVNYTSTLVTGEQYRIYYKVDGANTIAETSVVVLLNNASGTFSIPAAKLPNSGLSTFTITEIDYANGLGCGQSGLTVTDDFTIEPAPDVTTITVTASDVCEGEDEVVDVTGSLADATYSVKYDISGANTVAGQTIELIIVGGAGQFIIPASEIPGVGGNTITITSIAGNSGSLCSANPVDGTASFDIIPTPVNGLTVTNPIICEGDDAIISIMASEPLVEYTLSPGGEIIAGTGSDIMFTAVSPAVTTVYTISASSTLLACDPVQLINTSTVTVIPGPSDRIVSTSPEPSNLCQGDILEITVRATEANVKYTLATAGTPVAGQEFVGNGADQLFTVTPTVDTQYDIIAVPITLNDEGSSCAEVILSTSVIADVHGLITIDEQPADAYICSGSVAEFSVIASSESNDELNYQWQSSADNITFTDIVGELSPTLSVSSGSSDYYRVLVSSTYCAEVISNSVVVNTSATPVTDDITLAIDNVCLGSDVLVNYTSNLATNEEYRFYFNISGANEVPDTSVVSLLTAGSGSFIMRADHFPNTGTNVLSLTGIDYANGLGCASTGLSVSEGFKVDPLPNITGISIAGEPTCEGYDGAVEIRGALEDNLYSITYDLAGDNVASSLTGTLVIQGGVGIYSVPAAEIPNTGNTQFILVDITNTGGSSCPSEPLNLSTEIIVEQVPSIISMAITAVNICQGSPAVVTVSGNLSDGEYTISYTVSGANSVSNDELLTISSGDGSGEFSIDNSLLPNAGTNQIELTDIGFTTGSSCIATGVGIGTSFEIEPTPDLTGAEIYAPKICIGENATVYFTSNLDNGDYVITYAIAGDNPQFSETITLSITGSTGNGSFVIDQSLLPNPGSTTITVSSVSNSYGNDCSIDVLMMTPLIIETPPDITDMTLVAEDICPGTSTIVSITGNLQDGKYLIYYNLSGVNAVNDIPNLLEIESGDGSGSFTVHGYDLQNSGLTTLSLTAIAFVKGSDCSLADLDISTDFNVQSLPDLSDLTVTMGNACLGNGETVNLSSTSVTDGIYDLIYELQGSNASGSDTTSVTFESGEGSFLIDAEKLPNTGLTTVLITDVISDQGCPTGGTELAQFEFEVEPLPGVDGFIVYALDACEGSRIRVLGTSNFEAGSYELSYVINGSNTRPTRTVNVDVSSGNGNFEFAIPAFVLPNTGSSTITVEYVRFNTGLQCGEVTSSSSNFKIYPQPTANNMTITAADVCQGKDLVFDVMSELLDGNYDLTIEVSGANVDTINTVLELTNGDGTGQFALSRYEVLLGGDTHVEIIEIKDQIGIECSTAVTDVAFDAYIEPLPNIIGMHLDMASICLGADGLAMISGNLADGSYIVTYDLVGANNAIDQGVTLDVSGGDGIGEFIIPSSLIVNQGQSDLIITSVANNGGLNCKIISNVSDDFVAVSIDGSFDANLDIQSICIGNDALVNITTNLPDLVYQLTYDLTGANEVSGLQSDIIASAGSASFTIDAANLPISGVQSLSITAIEAIGVETCTAGNLLIDAMFDIEGPLSITTQPVTNDQCEGFEVTYTGAAENQGAGTLLYQWMESSDNGTSYIALNDQGVYSGTDSPTLVISDNEGLSGNMYKLTAFTSNCSFVESDAVTLTNLTGAICGEGLDNLPDAFSPNGDGVNDYWEITGLEYYPNNKVQVFNRWGNLVYEGLGYNNGTVRFEGRRNVGGGDNNLADGTYFFLIEIGDGSEKMEGFLVINR